MSSSGPAPPFAKRHVSFIVMGHSQSGKSTVVGAILQLTDSLREGVFEAVETGANAVGQSMRRFAWITDRSREERDQLHTITPKLWCLDFDEQQISLIDTPGHRSCALMCIASMCMADAALLVVSCKRGEFEASISSEGKDLPLRCIPQLIRSPGGARLQLLAAFALGVKSVVVAVSQMDDASCSFGQARFQEIQEKMRLLLRKAGFFLLYFAPIAAKASNRRSSGWF
jgi:elongation factor 1-alpha